MNLEDFHSLKEGDVIYLRSAMFRNQLGKCYFMGFVGKYKARVKLENGNILVKDLKTLSMESVNP